MRSQKKHRVKENKKQKISMKPFLRDFLIFFELCANQHNYLKIIFLQIIKGLETMKKYYFQQDDAKQIRLVLKWLTFKFSTNSFKSFNGPQASQT